MIYECRVNLKNKRKDDLIMYLEEALQTIQKQDTEINKLNNVIDRMVEEYEYNARINVKYFCDEEMRKDKCIQDCKSCIKEYFMKEDK